MNRDHQWIQPPIGSVGLDGSGFRTDTPSASSVGYTTTAASNSRPSSGTQSYRRQCLPYTYEDEAGGGAPTATASTGSTPTGTIPPRDSTAREYEASGIPIDTSSSVQTPDDTAPFFRVQQPSSSASGGERGEQPQGLALPTDDAGVLQFLSHGRRPQTAGASRATREPMCGTCTNESGEPKEEVDIDENSVALVEAGQSTCTGGASNVNQFGSRPLSAMSIRRNLSLEGEPALPPKQSIQPAGQPREEQTEHVRSLPKHRPVEENVTPVPVPQPPAKATEKSGTLLPRRPSTPAALATPRQQHRGSIDTTQRNVRGARFGAADAKLKSFAAVANIAGDKQFGVNSAAHQRVRGPIRKRTTQEGETSRPPSSAASSCSSTEAPEGFKALMKGNARGGAAYGYGFSYQIHQEELARQKEREAAAAARRAAPTIRLNKAMEKRAAMNQERAGTAGAQRVTFLSLRARKRDQKKAAASDATKRIIEERILAAQKGAVEKISRWLLQCKQRTAIRAELRCFYRLRERNLVIEVWRRNKLEQFRHCAWRLIRHLKSPRNNGAASKIQGLWKGHLERHRYQTMKRIVAEQQRVVPIFMEAERLWYAARLLQRAWRLTLLTRKLRPYTATRLAHRVRLVQHRARERFYLRERTKLAQGIVVHHDAAARVIQRAYRLHLHLLEERMNKFRREHFPHHGPYKALSED